MRLKSFYGASLSDAMNQIRASLGEDAIIIATREMEDGSGVRITAALEEEEEPWSGALFGSEEMQKSAYSGIAGHTDTFNDDGLLSEHDLMDVVSEALWNHGLPVTGSELIISRIMEQAVLQSDHPLTANHALLSSFSELFSFRPHTAKLDAKSYIFVGPPGAGKTLSVAKIATQAVVNGQKPVVISTDTIRAGGTEQLEAFTRVLDLSLLKVEDPAALVDTIAHTVKVGTPVLIDTAGQNPFDPSDLDTMNELLKVPNSEKILVLGAGWDAEETGDMAANYINYGVDTLIITRLDIARRLGGLLQAACMNGLSLWAFSNSPKVTEPLQALTPEGLAQFVLPPNTQSSSNTIPLHQRKAS